MKEKKATWGGARAGSGRKDSEVTGEEKRIQKPLTVLPSVFSAFQKKHGRKWSSEVEKFMQQDCKNI